MLCLFVTLTGAVFPASPPGFLAFDGMSSALAHTAQQKKLSTFLFLSLIFTANTHAVSQSQTGQGLRAHAGTHTQTLSSVMLLENILGLPESCN